MLTDDQLTQVDPAAIFRRTFKYSLTDCLHADTWPGNTDDQKGSLLLNLEIANVQPQLECLIDLSCMASDEDLVRVLEAYLAYCRGETTSPSRHCYDYINPRYRGLDGEAPVEAWTLPPHLTENQRGCRRDALRLREAKEASKNFQLLQMADYRDGRGGRFRPSDIAKALRLTTQQVYYRLHKLRNPVQ